jgi:hypothetical protein
MKMLTGLLSALCMMLAAMPANAVMLYRISGNFTATNPDNPGDGFTDAPISFLGVGDDTVGVDNSNNFTVYEFGLSHLYVTDPQGMQFDLGTSFKFLTAPSMNAVGLGNATGLLFAFALPAPYSGTGTYAATGFTGLIGSEEVTVLGDAIHFQDAANGIFSASPAPEPATWATFLLGFGVAGALGRQRRSAVPAMVNGR